MTRTVIPMIHVPSVEETAAWYRSIGFDVVDTGSDGADMVWAMLTYGESAIMLSAGGERSDRPRREMDLYLYTDDVDAEFEKLRERVEIVEGLHDTFYGTREFIIRDLNRFWITFGQEIAPRG
ncbi:MAG: VOC family protein [Thermoanaerobaculia bacterium]